MAAGSSWPASLCNQPASAWPGCPPAPVPAWSSPAASTPGRLQPPGADHLASKPCLESPDYLPGSDSHLDGRQNISFWEIQVIAEMLLSSTIQYYGPRPRLTSFSRPSLVILVFFWSQLVLQGQSLDNYSKVCKKNSFCESGKFLRHVHYWLKNFRMIWKMYGCYTKYPDNMQSDDVESVWMIEKVSG